MEIEIIAHIKCKTPRKSEQRIRQKHLVLTEIQRFMMPRSGSNPVSSRKAKSSWSGLKRDWEWGEWSESHQTKAA